MGLFKSLDDLAHGALLHNLACLHDDDAIGEVPYYRQIVGDEKIGQADSRRSPSTNSITCACIEASRVETASSQTISFGSTASARAIAMRCLWPPENRRG